MNVAFDHVVVVVPDLARATRDFESAGFVVTPGGRHDAIPTENALIVFEDAGYLELLAPRDDEALESMRRRMAPSRRDDELRRASAIARRFLPRLAGPPGVADFVLRAGNLARVAREMRAGGVVATGPLAMARERTDGLRLEWQLVLPAEARFPFLIEDHTDRSLRVPASPAHPNGAVGVGGVRVRVADVAAAALEYADRFGVRPRVDAAGGTSIDLAGLEVTLEAGEPEGASGVTIRGVASLGETLERLGVVASGV